MTGFTSFLFLYFALIAIKFSTCSKADDSDGVPLISVKQGLIKGIKEKSVNGRVFSSYMGIPFAEPPVGKLRFKDPIPSEPWNSILDGSKMPLSCLQKESFLVEEKNRKTTLLGKEDCLYLNVYVPTAGESREKLPVMIWIHGGAFVFGGADQYLPHVLMDRHVILVVIQYRLGIFGFLSTEDPVMPGNMGLKDQQMALKWVKENIGAFGGDPETITIFGESAGSASVHYQILSPGSKGLFKRVIMQSGNAQCLWASNINHRKFAIETGAQFNCSIDFGTEAYLECMQNVNALFLPIAAADTVKWTFTPYYVLPRVDGDFISEKPGILMKEEKYNKVEVMAGITRDEGALVLLTTHREPELLKNLNQNFEEFGPISLQLQDKEDAASLAREIYQYYLEREDVTVRDADRPKILKLNTDAYFRVCHDSAMQFFANDEDINLHLYQLDHVAKSSLGDSCPSFEKSDMVSHVDDVMYLFQGGSLLPEAIEDKTDLQLRDLILDLWTNFARTGNPNLSNEDFKWEQPTKKNLRYLSLIPNPVMQDDTFQEIRQFWASLKTRQNLILEGSARAEGKQNSFEKQEL